MRLAGRDLEPVPILLVIIDEYLELFHHHQEWIQLVIHIGQEGRGCNVFFTLGGQRLDLSSLSKAKSNIAFRVALRAETAEDSRDVIGSDAALHLPSKENGYALMKVGPRDLEPFRCFYLSAPFVLPKKVANVNRTIDVSFSQPRPLTWEYQPLSADDTAALAVADEPDEPDEFLFHSDGFRKKKLLDVIRDSLISTQARLPHQIWLPPLEISEPVDALVSYWRGKPWHVDYGQNPGLTFPIGIVDIPEDHTQLVHVHRRRDGQHHGGRHRPARQEHHVDDVDDVGGVDVPPRAGDVLLHRGVAVSDGRAAACGRCRQPQRHRRGVADDRDDRGTDPRPRGVVQALSDRHLRIPGTTVRRSRRRRNRSGRQVRRRLPHRRQLRRPLRERLRDGRSRDRDCPPRACRTACTS